MRFLFDLNHPAHVHLLRHPYAALRARGHQCLVAARDKDVALQLLRGYAIPYQVLAPLGRGLVGQARELVVREWRFWRLARGFQPQLILGSSAHAARVARLLGARSAILSEDDADAVPVFAWIAYPLASAIITPDCLRDDHGRRHHTYPSYHELFYLHPNRFTPDPAVRTALGLGAGEPYALVRLSALAAHHDVGVRGVGEELLRALVELTAGRLRLFITSEKPLSAELEPLRIRLAPERMHDALAFADFYLGDSQTMTAEAAVLGTPAFRMSDWVGRLSYLEDLQRYGLAFGFRPGQERLLLDQLGALLALPDRRAQFAARRERLLADKIDPLPWFVDTLEKLALETATGGGGFWGAKPPA